MKVGIVGISGRMGQELQGLAKECGATIVGGVSREKSKDKIPHFKTVDEMIRKAKPSIVIDFSLPDLTADVAAACAAYKTPLVSGVTGLSSTQEKALKVASANTKVLWSPNMSLGIAVVRRMLRELSSFAEGEVQIEELHHRNKKDRPSGTAKLIEADLKKAVGKRLQPTISLRGGGIFGIHRILAMGTDETISIEHTALNRRVFARGAFHAAAWLLRAKKPGLYGIDDVL